MKIQLNTHNTNQKFHDIVNRSEPSNRFQDKEYLKYSQEANKNIERYNTIYAKEYAQLS